MHLGLRGVAVAVQQCCTYTIHSSNGKAMMLNGQKGRQERGTESVNNERVAHIANEARCTVSQATTEAHHS